MNCWRFAKLIITQAVTYIREVLPHSLGHMAINVRPATAISRRNVRGFSHSWFTQWYWLNRIEKILDQQLFVGHESYPEFCLRKRCFRVAIHEFVVNALDKVHLVHKVPHCRYLLCFACWEYLGFDGEESHVINGTIERSTGEFQHPLSFPIRVSLDKLPDVGHLLGPLYITLYWPFLDKTVQLLAKSPQVFWVNVLQTCLAL